MWAVDNKIVEKKAEDEKEKVKQIKQSIGRLNVPPTKKISPATAYKKPKYKNDYLEDYEENF